MILVCVFEAKIINADFNNKNINYLFKIIPLCGILFVLDPKVTRTVMLKSY